jgi:hypothetical protein
MKNGCAIGCAVVIVHVTLNNADHQRCTARFRYLTHRRRSHFGLKGLVTPSGGVVRTTENLTALAPDVYDLQTLCISKAWFPAPFSDLLIFLSMRVRDIPQTSSVKRARDLEIVCLKWCRRKTRLMINNSDGETPGIYSVGKRSKAEKLRSDHARGIWIRKSVQGCLSGLSVVRQDRVWMRWQATWTKRRSQPTKAT